MKMRQILPILGLIVPVLGCATASDVMDTGNGTYMISAHASWARGGAAGANQVAYKDANAYCQAHGGHAVVLGADSRDVYQSGFGGSVGPAGGSFGGRTTAAGNTDLRFRCAQ